MRAVFFIAAAVALAFQPHASLACSIDELRRVANDHLDRLPSSSLHEPLDPSEGSGDPAWQMFERESGTPHSIVMELLGEIGQWRVRTSFLNRRDFVIVETKIDYEKPFYAEDTTGRFKISPPKYYFFCDNTLQPEPGSTLSAESIEHAEHWKKKITESTGLLRQEFERIPQ